MSNHILNVISQFLCYADGVVTDNPHQKVYDFRRRMESLPISNPYSNMKVLAPGQSFSIFDGIIATGLTTFSNMTLSLVSAQDSIYRLSVTSGPSSFRTARNPSGISNCVITINNNSVADFDFPGAILSGIQSGDIMRIKGQLTHDTGPFAFNPINSGIWKVIAVNGTKVSCVRQAGESFQGIAETVAAAAADLEFYADDAIMPGHKISIEGAFSPVSRRVYEVKDSTPDTIDFVSAISLPLESNIVYTNGSIVCYNTSKKLVYVEVDQDCVIRFNGATDDSNKLNPVQVGNSMLPGYSHKWGETFKAEVVNKSVNQCTVRFFMCE